VLSVLAAAGIASESVDVATAAAAGRLEVERRCGRSFLATSGTRCFAPPVGSSYLDVGDELVSVSGVVYQAEGSAGETWTLNTDYWLLPLNAASRSLPYAGLQLTRSWCAPLQTSLHRAIQVSGNWGFASTIPEDAWLGMIYSGLLELLPSYAQSLTGGRTWLDPSSGDSTGWGIDPLGTERRSWGAYVRQVIGRYRRPVS
jgi:hypothetical protein